MDQIHELLFFVSKQELYLLKQQLSINETKNFF